MLLTINEHTSKCNEALPQFFIDNMDSVVNVEAAYGGKSCLVWFVDVDAVVSEGGEVTDTSSKKAQSKPFTPEDDEDEENGPGPVNALSGWSSPYTEKYSKMQSSRASSSNTRSMGALQLGDFLQTVLQPLMATEPDQSSCVNSNRRMRFVLRLSRQSKERQAIVARVLKFLHGETLAGSLSFKVPRNLPRQRGRSPAAAAADKEAKEAEEEEEEEPFFFNVSTGECAELVAFIPGLLLFRRESRRNIESFGRACGDLIVSLSAATEAVQGSEALVRNPRYFNFKLPQGDSDEPGKAVQDGWRVSNAALQGFLEESLSSWREGAVKQEALALWSLVLEAEQQHDAIRNKAQSDPASFPRHIVHGDLNLGNVLVSDASEGDTVTGILDFELCAVDLRVCDLVDAFLYLFDALGYAACWEPLFEAFFAGVAASRFRASTAEAEALYDLLLIKVMFTWRYRIEEASFGRRVEYCLKQLSKLNTTRLWLVAHRDKIREAAKLLCRSRRENE